MFTFTYVMVATTAVLLVAAAIVAFRNRTVALGIIAAAILAGIASAVLSAMSLNSDIGKKGYRAVREAAAQDAEVDATAQWALTDNKITPSEYGQIADVYRERTGREINDLAK
jgi:hypothetical protein